MASLERQLMDFSFSIHKLNHYIQVVQKLSFMWMGHGGHILLVMELESMDGIRKMYGWNSKNVPKLQFQHLKDTLIVTWVYNIPYIDHNVIITCLSCSICFIYDK